MSVQSEIQRLKNAKSDIIAAIAEKGVSVPSSTTLDGVADYIGEIESGSAPVQVGPTWFEIISMNSGGCMSNTDDYLLIPTYGGSVYISYDGIDYGSLPIYGFYYVASNNNKYLLAGGSLSSYSYSEDGENWNIDFAPEELASCAIETCFYFKGKFFIGTHDDIGAMTGNTKKFYYSTDLQHWTETSNGNFYSSAFEKNSEIVMAGSSDGIYYSTDGDIWFQLEHDFQLQSINKICYVNNIWFALGWRGELYYTNDLTSLNQVVVCENKISNIIYYNNNYYVATTGGIYTSSDLITWNLNKSGSFVGIASIQEKIVAVEEHRVYYSEDGLNWTEIYIWPEHWEVDVENNPDYISDIKVWYSQFLIFGNGLIASW